MFDRHGVPAVVRSAAIPGTQACQWASAAKGLEGPGSALADAAKRLFPELEPHGGPDHVWYTAGGNDFAESWYQQCGHAAKTLAASQLCIDKLTSVVGNCTQSLLEYYWARYPSSRVMQCGYDFPCTDTKQCQTVAARKLPHCGTDGTCQGEQTLYWQKMYIGALQARYEELRMPYAGLDISGAVQQAGGVPGAGVGSPVIGQGSPCDLMVECVHPIYGKAGATAVGEAFWELYFSKHPKRN